MHGNFEFSVHACSRSSTLNNGGGFSVRKIAQDEVLGWGIITKGCVWSGVQDDFSTREAGWRSVGMEVEVTWPFRRWTLCGFGREARGAARFCGFGMQGIAGGGPCGALAVMSWALRTNGGALGEILQNALVGGRMDWFGQKE